MLYICFIRRDLLSLTNFVLHDLSLNRPETSIQFISMDLTMGEEFVKTLSSCGSKNCTNTTTFPRERFSGKIKARTFKFVVEFPAICAHTVGGVRTPKSEIHVPHKPILASQITQLCNEPLKKTRNLRISVVSTNFQYPRGWAITAHIRIMRNSLLNH